MAESTNKSTDVKDARPPKPYPDYPLYYHRSGRIARKVNGSLRYFGRWGHKRGAEVVPVDDVPAAAAAALEEFNRQWPYLSQGVAVPASDDSAAAIDDLVKAFWRAKHAKLSAGELSQRHYHDLGRMVKLVREAFGSDRRVDTLRPDDFAKLRESLAARLGPVALKNWIAKVKSLFRFAYDERLIDKPVHYGQSFNPPPKKAIRKARNEAGERLFKAHEIRTILDALAGKPVAVTGSDDPVTLAPDPQLRAMVLLAANTGFGNTDVSTLPQSALDLEGGWVNFPRPKTEIRRRVPLWPETVEALRQALAVRPKPSKPEYADRCFLTTTGKPFVRMDQKQGSTDLRPQNYLSMKVTKLLKALHINGRAGLGLYTLRHNLQTIGGRAKDPEAVSAIMGHADQSMAAMYRERIDDDRLRAVTETVRQWLWNE